MKPKKINLNKCNKIILNNFNAKEKVKKEAGTVRFEGLPGAGFHEFETVFSNVKARSKYYNKKWVFWFNLSQPKMAKDVIHYLTHELDDQHGYDEYFKKLGETPYNLLKEVIQRNVITLIEYESCPPINPHFQNDPDGIDWSLYNNWEALHETYKNYHKTCFYGYDATILKQTDYLKFVKKKDDIYRFSLSDFFVSRLKFMLGEEQFLKLTKTVSKKIQETFKDSIAEFMDELPQTTSDAIMTKPQDFPDFYQEKIPF